MASFKSPNKSPLNSQPVNPEDAEPLDNRTTEQKANDAENLVNVEKAGHVTKEYGAGSIQVLEGLEGVRRNVAMYIGDNNAKGLHHLFTEICDNSIDEALAGHCTKVDVILYADGSVSVQDDGRGFPIDINPTYNIPGVELALTKLHAGGKFDSGAYKVSGGLHGVGASCVNATSDWMKVTVTRDGKVHQIGFQRGLTTEPLKTVGKAGKGEHGTLVHWHADPEIFGEFQYDGEKIERRLRELAYLNKDLTLSFTNRRDLTSFVLEDPDRPENEKLIPCTKVFHYPKGLLEYVEHLNESKDALHRPIFFSGVRDTTIVEIAMQYNLSFQETILTFANNINTSDGGTHLSGFKTALTRVLNNYARKNNILKEKDLNFTGDDAREGLTCVISVKLTTRPQFESQTKVRLTNADVEGAVSSIVGEKFGEFLEENSAVAKRILDKALTSQRARDAARRAAELVKRQSALENNSLPGKLADCSDKDPKKCELFLVEGDSAGGPAKQGRDRRTQAVLPLRGKILNAGKTRVDKVLENEEIRAMITALGTGICYGTDEEEEVVEEITEDSGYANVPGASNGNGKSKKSYDLTKLRYDKIIIMTDADVDGDHIRTLLLTFFWIYMRPLITEGHVYVAQPPLYRVKVGKNDQYYAKNEEERDKIIKGLKNKKDVHVTRFKGLGEMDSIDLAETTMEVDKRRLAQVHIDSDNLSAAIEMFDIFMSDKVEPRRDFIVAHAKEVSDVDWDG